MKIITSSNGKKKINISKNEWETIGKKHGWSKKAEDETERITLKVPDRIENLRNIAKYMIEKCSARDTELMNRLWGYGQQLLIIAKELEHKLELMETSLVENPEGWD